VKIVGDKAANKIEITRKMQKLRRSSTHRRATFNPSIQNGRTHTKQFAEQMPRDRLTPRSFLFASSLSQNEHNTVHP
jgi:hypothetical protein